MQNHKFVIKPKTGHEDALSNWSNTEVWLDGKRLDTVIRVAFTLEANGASKVCLEMYGQVEVDALISDTQLKIGKSKDDTFKDDSDNPQS